MNNWAPFTHGYQSHEVLNDRESIWTVKGDLGPISRVTRVHVTITEWLEGDRVGFSVEGLSEPLAGQGAIDLRDGDTATTTVIRGEATINFGGSLGPVVNHLIAPFIQAGADELVARIVIAITGEAPERPRRLPLILAPLAGVWSGLRAIFRRLARLATGSRTSG